MFKHLIVIIALSILTSCASSTKEQIKEDKMSVGSIDRSEMVSRMRESIEKIPGITKDQTERILNLHADIFHESEEINRKIYQDKVVLFKYLAENKNKEMELVKKDIQKLYAQKLDLMLNAFGKVKKILGKDTHKMFMHDDFKLYHGFSQERF